MEKKNIVRITKKFDFEAAHALCGYDGACESIHGHSYVLYVTLKGNVSDDNADPKLGMVMDFSILKKIVKEKIIDVFDHSLLIKEDSPHANEPFFKNNKYRVIILPFQPTCENMVIYMAHQIKSKLPKNTELHSLRLHETATAYSEWYAEDNV